MRDVKKVIEVIKSSKNNYKHNKAVNQYLELACKKYPHLEVKLRQIHATAIRIRSLGE